MAKNRLTLAATLLFVVCFVFTDKASACMCQMPSTVLGELERSENVFIGRTQNVENTEWQFNGINRKTILTLFKVEKVYKGPLFKGETIKVESGCSMNFAGYKIGDQFLIYARKAGEDQKTKEAVYSTSCTRSNTLKNLTADLEYLNNIDKYLGKTRLSGTLRQRGDNVIFPSFENIKIRIRGEDFYTETETDSNGFFEIWDIPTGDYEVAYDVPSDWRIGTVQRIPYHERPLNKNTKNVINAAVHSRSHTEILSYLVNDNRISGRVTSPDGKPLENICVSMHRRIPESRIFSSSRIVLTIRDLLSL
ncbi:MAG: hypothetical protein KF685_10145 [Acidobacteria bacterium]|nr:hypothetical protein [Acidobacteriota bacterium]